MNSNSVAVQVISTKSVQPQYCQGCMQQLRAPTHKLTSERLRCAEIRGEHVGPHRRGLSAVCRLFAYQSSLRRRAEDWEEITGNLSGGSFGIADVRNTRTWAEHCPQVQVDKPFPSFCWSNIVTLLLGKAFFYEVNGQSSIKLCRRVLFLLRKGVM